MTLWKESRRTYTAEQTAERHKHIERQTKKVIAAELRHADLYLGAPGSQSPGRKPKKSEMK